MESLVGSSTPSGFVSQTEIDRCVKGDTRMTAQAARLTAAAAPAMMAMVVGGPVLGLLVFGAGVMVPKAVRLIRRHKKLAKLKERGCVSEDTSLQDVADIRNMLKT